MHGESMAIEESATIGHERREFREKQKRFQGKKEHQPRRPIMFELQ